MRYIYIFIFFIPTTIFSQTCWITIGTIQQTQLKYKRCSTYTDDDPNLYGVLPCTYFSGSDPVYGWNAFRTTTSAPYSYLFVGNRNTNTDWVNDTGCGIYNPSTIATSSQWSTIVTQLTTAPNIIFSPNPYSPTSYQYTFKNSYTYLYFQNLQLLGNTYRLNPENTNPYINNPILYITFSSSSLSLDTFSNEIVSLYPNPTQNTFHLDIENEFKGTICDVAGKFLMNVNTKDTDISNLSPGIYFLNITSEGKQYIKKIIKE